MMEKKSYKMTSAIELLFHWLFKLLELNINSDRGSRFDVSRSPTLSPEHYIPSITNYSNQDPNTAD